MGCDRVSMCDMPYGAELVCCPLPRSFSSLPLLPASTTSDQDLDLGDDAAVIVTRSTVTEASSG